MVSLDFAIVDDNYKTWAAHKPFLDTAIVYNQHPPLLWYNSRYEFIYRYGEVLTQLPFEIKVQMPPTDSGKRGYSDTYINQLKAQY